MGMAASPRETTVEIDGLWFRIQKLRGRRAVRGVRALQTALGVNGYLMVSQPKFWTATLHEQLTALVTVETQTQSSYDEHEDALAELLAFSSDAGGQGASYRDTPPNPSDPGRGWIPIRNLSTLDTFDSVDHTTWQALRWEMIKLTYRPTSAATGTDPGTRPAATSTQASGPSGQAAPPPAGSPRPAAPTLGISAG
jgi:hypothetical protein